MVVGFYRPMVDVIPLDSSNHATFSVPPTFHSKNASCSSPTTGILLVASSEYPEYYSCNQRGSATGLLDDLRKPFVDRYSSTG